jgi:hypothetical protein
MKRKTTSTHHRSILMSLCCVATAFIGSVAVPAAADKPGAHALASIPVVEVPTTPVYWHLDTFPTRAAADAAKEALGTVVETFGQVWLFTLAEPQWRPNGGKHVATIGPLRLHPGTRYTADYMQAATLPGFRTNVHQHGGPEGLFTLSGEVCVETPEGKVVGRAGGDPVVIDGEVPMQLTSIGHEVRRSLILIFHDEAQPWKVPAARPWKPKGLCSMHDG